MQANERQRIRRGLIQASAPKWVVRSNTSDSRWRIDGPRGRIGEIQLLDDAEFIASARADVPRMLDRIDELERLLAESADAIRRSREAQRQLRELRAEREAALAECRRLREENARLAALLRSR